MRDYRIYLDKKPPSLANNTHKSFDSPTDQVIFNQAQLGRSQSTRKLEYEQKTRALDRIHGRREKKDCFGDDYTAAWVLIRPLSVVNEAWTRKGYIVERANLASGVWIKVIGLPSERPAATSYIDPSIVAG